MPEETGMTKQQLRYELMLAREEIHRLRHELKIIGARNSSYFDKLERYRLTVTRLEQKVKDLGGDPWERPTIGRMQRRSDMFNAAYIRTRLAGKNELADQHALAGTASRIAIDRVIGPPYDRDVTL